MKRYTVCLKRILLLLLGLLFASCESTNFWSPAGGKPVAPDELVSVKGIFSVKAPHQAGWTVKTDEVRGGIRFDSTHHKGRFVAITFNYSKPEATNLTEEELAASIFDDEERVMIERSRTASWYS